MVARILLRFFERFLGACCGPENFMVFASSVCCSASVGLEFHFPLNWQMTEHCSFSPNISQPAHNNCQLPSLPFHISPYSKALMNLTNCMSPVWQSSSMCACLFCSEGWLNACLTLGQFMHWDFSTCLTLIRYLSVLLNRNGMGVNSKNPFCCPSSQYVKNPALIFVSLLHMHFHKGIYVLIIKLLNFHNNSFYRKFSTGNIL